MIIFKGIKQFNRLRKTNLTFCFSKEQEFDFIYGINPVQCALHSRKRKLHSLFLSDSEHIQLSSKTNKLILLAKENSIPIIFTHKDKMSRLVKQQPHQNIILKCSPLKLEAWDRKQIKKGVYVYCDKITDPQNFGAILRSCLFFGVEAVFTGKKNHCPLNTTVLKTSVGAAEIINTFLVQNSQQFIAKWKNQGGVVVSTSVDESKPHISAQQLHKTLKLQKIDKVLLIIGSEGLGVSPHLISISDFLVSIERRGIKQHPFNLIDSLNVSAALSVLLFELTRLQ